MKQVTRLIDKLPKHNSSDFVAILGRVELEVKADTRLKQIYVQGRADADLGKHVFAPKFVRANYLHNLGACVLPYEKLSKFG
ncbi:hypothetical protein, partial [Vibrio atlanticus]